MINFERIKAPTKNFSGLFIGTRDMDQKITAYTIARKTLSKEAQLYDFLHEFWSVIYVHIAGSLKVVQAMNAV